MNSIFRIKQRVVSFIVVFAFGVGVISASIPARATIPVIDYTHIIHTIFEAKARYEQLRIMLKNIKDLKGWEHSEFLPMEQQQMVREIVDLYNQGKSLAYTMQDIDEQFKSQYPGYEEYIQEIKLGSLDNLPASYKELAESSFDNARLAMKAARVNISAFDDEDKTMQKLLALSQSAGGQMQVIQISNEIAAQQMQQMQKLRQMIANQITLQSNWLAQQARLDARGNALREKLNMQQIENSQPQRWQVADRDQMSRDNQGNRIRLRGW